MTPVTYIDPRTAPGPRAVVANCNAKCVSRRGVAWPARLAGVQLAAERASLRRALRRALRRQRWAARLAAF